MTPEHIISMVKLMLSLGANPETVDPTIKLWQSSPRGRYHTTDFCSRLQTRTPSTTQTRITDVTPGRVCSSCAGYIVTNNRELVLHARVAEYAAEALKLEKRFASEQYDAEWRLQTLMKVRALREELPESQSSDDRYAFVTKVRARIDEAIAKMESLCEGASVEHGLLRKLAVKLLTNHRTGAYEAARADRTIFPKHGPATLDEIFNTWCNVYVATGDVSEANSRTRQWFTKHGDLAGTEQLQFATTCELAPSANLADSVKELWRVHALETLGRLTASWAESVEQQIGNAERDHLIFFRYQFELEDVPAALAALYTVAHEQDVLALRAPKVVANWIQRESLQGWMLKDVGLFKGRLDDPTVLTAVTLYLDGQSGAYNTFLEAIRAAKRL